MRIYVDGCSYTAGHGLAKRFSLASLMAQCGHDVIDKSRVGKSNYSMALDLHAEQNDFDFYVIGWTYAQRVEYQFDDVRIDGSVSQLDIGLGNHLMGDFLEKEYKELNARFFRYISRFDNFSDFAVDSCAALLSRRTIKFFSWEERRCTTPLMYPKFDQSHRQQDTENWQTVGHLNEAGMHKLCNMILNS